jgi:hypothetical protein
LPGDLTGPVFLLDVFRANGDFIVNGLNFQGNDHVTWSIFKISNQWTTLVPQIFPLARPIGRIR